MREDSLGPLVSGGDIKSGLRRRKKKDVHRTVSGSSKQLERQKVKIEEAEGWQVFKRNTKSRRLAKPKPAAEQHEDEIWTILAQMGFKEMSQGRQFRVVTQKGLKPRQIDVFAKDNETAIIVECTQRDELVWCPANNYHHSRPCFLPGCVAPPYVGPSYGKARMCAPGAADPPGNRKAQARSRA